MQMLKPGYPTCYGSDGAEALVCGAQRPGFNQMKHLKNLMLSLPYFERVPDQASSPVRMAKDITVCWLPRQRLSDGFTITTVFR